MVRTMPRQTQKGEKRVFFVFVFFSLSFSEKQSNKAKSGKTNSTASLFPATVSNNDSSSDLKKSMFWFVFIVLGHWWPWCCPDVLHKTRREQAHLAALHYTALRRQRQPFPQVSASAYWYNLHGFMLRLDCNKWLCFSRTRTPRSPPCYPKSDGLLIK